MTINEQLIKDDLYQAVNGDWLATAKIPADKPATGGFSLLGDQVEEQIKGRQNVRSDHGVRSNNEAESPCRTNDEDDENGEFQEPR